jgi:hypothetical protein
VRKDIASGVLRNQIDDDAVAVQLGRASFLGSREAEFKQTRSKQTRIKGCRKRPHRP